MSETTVTVTELTYIDPAVNADKFYRVFVLGDTVTCQYGRNGTFGAWTPRKAYGSPEAAHKAADKTVAAKMGKGYNASFAGPLALSYTASDSELDLAANRLMIADLEARRTGSTAAPTVAMPALREQSSVVAAANAAPVADAETFTRITAELHFHLGHPVFPVQDTGTVTRPMLADILPPADLAHVLGSSAWVAQSKLDGDRVVVEVIDGVVSVLNRSGQPKVKNVGEAHLAPFRVLTAGRWAFDGEVVGRKLWLFDMPAAGLFHDEVVPFSKRYDTLTVTLRALGIDADDEHIGLVKTTSGTEAKKALLAESEAAGKEGVIFRSTVGSYEHGRRSVNLLKHKFVKEADCVVTAVGVGGKQNIEVGVYNGRGEMQVVGQVTTIGKSDGTGFAVGEVVEVRFLYVTNAEHPRLYQPRIMRKRHDKVAAECSIAQFAHTVTDKTV